MREKNGGRVRERVVRKGDSVLERELVRKQREPPRAVIMSKKLPKRANGLLCEIDVYIIGIYLVYVNVL